MPRKAGVPNVIQRQTKLEARKGELVGMLAIGTPLAQIREEMGCNPRSLWLFKTKYRDEINEAMERRNRRLADYSIAQQVDRIAELQWWYDRTLEEAKAHGVAESDETGMRIYKATLVKEARGILRDAAEELGQIKQPAKQEISTHQTYVLQLVRNDHSDIPQLG